MSNNINNDEGGYILNGIMYSKDGKTLGKAPKSENYASAYTEGTPKSTDESYQDYQGPQRVSLREAFKPHAYIHYPGRISGANLTSEELKKRKTKDKLIANILFAIFGGIGLLLIAIGLVIFIYGRESEKNTENVEACITDINYHVDGEDDSQHAVFVNYEYDDEYYSNVELDLYTIIMQEGDTIDILVNRDNPYDITKKGNWMIASVILWIIGGVFTFVGIIVKVAIILYC